MRPSATVAEAWSRLQPPEPEWDWEAACIDGKLFRFGYCHGHVLVLVLHLDETRIEQGPSH